MKNGWDDERVRRERMEQHNAVVNGKRYRSVKHAFIELGIPRDHKPFRKALKSIHRAGCGEYSVHAYGHSWRLSEPE
jgi:hypothetical protein